MILTLLASLALLANPTTDEPLTVAESSEFTRTASHAQVLEFIDELAAMSDIVRVAEFGTSSEGRLMPMMVLANPPVETAMQAKASCKTITFIFANIHAGEVCGKEATLMLARELAHDPKHEFLKDQVIVILPDYNPDGNDQFGPVARNRPGQNGPQEVGVRPNAQGFDLNRDYIKLEAPETRAMVKFLNEWDPHLIIDCHTTNGSYHRYTLTYDAPLNPSGAMEPILYIRDTLLPEVTGKLKERTGYDTFFYGNFNRAMNVWQTYSAEPRFGGNYHGLRGAMSILSEAYSYASFEDRVKCTLEFLREILDYVSRHDTTMRELHDRAKADTVARGENPQPDDTVGLRHEFAAFLEPVTILSYEFEGEAGRGIRRRPTTEPKEYSAVYQGRFEPTLSVARPWAYLIPPGNDDLVELLRLHGVQLRSFSGGVRSEIYTVTKVQRSSREFQGHRLGLVDATAHRENRAYRDATLVPTAQPLGNLIAYLLEPQSADGVAAWDLLGDRVREGAEYPIVRIARPEDRLNELRLGDRGGE